MQDNQGNIIDRLFSSFTDLEQSINRARDTLVKKGNVPAEILKRIESYDGILLKQRSLANSLRSHINSGNWDEVARHVNLINGLSAMIRDDARAILSALSSANQGLPVDNDDEDINYC